MLCYTLDKAFLTNSYKMFYINVLYFIKPEKKLLKIRGNIFKAGGGNNVDVTVTYLVDSC